MGVTRRDLLVLLASSALAAAGCGGGGSSSGGAARGNAPTATTRARVENIHGMIARGLSQGGAVGFADNAINNGILLARFGQGMGGFGGGGTGGTTGGTTGGGGGMPAIAAPPPPRTGEFLANVAAAPPNGRKVRIGRAAKRQEVITPIAPGEPTDLPPPPDWQLAPNFYFDYYLNLWVEVTDTPSKSLYRLYEDDAKTLPAGKIETVYPTDWETFPQEYSSTYEYTAGYLAGSHGFSKNTTNADYSGKMSYENVYADGWKDHGESNWSGKGDSSWTSRYETGGGQWGESSGTFRSNGSGGTRTKSSDGYEAVYTYNQDGSGRGRITGPDPGLPVTLIWDAFGSTTITYADGTVERFPGWNVFDDGGVGGGTTGSSPGDPGKQIPVVTQEEPPSPPIITAP